MAVKIRCRRTGANNDPCYRIVVTDGRCPRDGKSIEILGWYDPKKKDKNFCLKLDKIEAWRQKGAQLSNTVKNLVKKAKKGEMVSTSVINEVPVAVEKTVSAESEASV